MVLGEGKSRVAQWKISAYSAGQLEPQLKRLVLAFSAFVFFLGVDHQPVSPGIRALRIAFTSPEMLLLCYIPTLYDNLASWAGPAVAATAQESPEVPPSRP